MNWIRLSSEYPRHRKVLRLVCKLGELAELYPIRLWLWAVEHSLHGHLKDIEPAELARIVGHAGDAQELWEAMLSCGFLERDGDGLRIRSWHEHQGILIDRSRRNTERMRAVRERPQGKALLDFPTVGGEEWALTQEKLAEWERTYPMMDVQAECRKARQWLSDNPARRKTARGMDRFLGSWLSRAQDGGKYARRQVSSTLAPVEDWRENLIKATLRANRGISDEIAESIIVAIKWECKTEEEANQRVAALLAEAA